MGVLLPNWTENYRGLLAWGRWRLQWWWGSLISPPCLASSRLAAASVFSPGFPGPCRPSGPQGHPARLVVAAWHFFFFPSSDSDCLRFPIGSPSDQTVAPLPVITAPPKQECLLCWRCHCVYCGGKENASWQGGENGVGCGGGESLFDGVEFQLGSVTEFCRWHVDGWATRWMDLKPLNWTLTDGKHHVTYFTTIKTFKKVFFEWRNNSFWDLERSGSIRRPVAPGALSFLEPSLPVSTSLPASVSTSVFVCLCLSLTLLLECLQTLPTLWFPSHRP